jgi:hypothetical protein
MNAGHTLTTVVQSSEIVAIERKVPQAQFKKPQSETENLQNGCWCPGFPNFAVSLVRQTEVQTIVELSRSMSRDLPYILRIGNSGDFTNMSIRDESGMWVIVFEILIRGRIDIHREERSRHCASSRPDDLRRKSGVDL